MLYFIGNGKTMLLFQAESAMNATQISYTTSNTMLIFALNVISG